MATERNAEPEEKWLEVLRHLESAARIINNDSARIDYLGSAVLCLYRLLEPASVRERRLSE